MTPIAIKCPGKSIDIVPELRIGPRIIQGGIAKRILVGKLIHHAVKHLGEGQVNQCCPSPRHICHFWHYCQTDGSDRIFFHVTAHKVWKLWKNNACIIKIGCPAFNPFQRNIAVIFNRTKREHHIVNRANLLRPSYDTGSCHSLQLNP